MKKKLFLRYFMLIFCLSFIIHHSAFIIAEEKTNLAVAEFEARNVSAMDAVTISDFLRTELVKTGVFNVVDRSNMQKILAEQKFQMTGCTNQDCAIQMGKILNVQKIVIGNLSRLAGMFYITSSIIDVETGRISFSERIECKLDTDLVKGVERLAENLSSDLNNDKLQGNQEYAGMLGSAEISPSDEKLESKSVESPVFNFAIFLSPLLLLLIVR